MSGNDGSESVEQFLARVASIQDTKDDVNAEKNRRMEEEILKSRKERQARRAERARSLSPSKTGPAATLPRTLDPVNIALTPPVDFRPTRTVAVSSPAPSFGLPAPREDVHTIATTVPSRSPATNEAPSPVQQKSAALARSGTLSWQQRPNSRDGTTIKRPLSASASGRLSPGKGEGPSQEAGIPSRRDISATLSQKDPTWFRQTQDRANISAAFRKNQVEDTPTQNTAVKLVRLPGMPSGYSNVESSKTSDQGHEAKPEVPATRLDVDDTDRFKRGATPDITALRESMAIPPTKVRPVSPELQAHSDATSRDDVNQNLLARGGSALSRTARSTSPTKGFGGFVESAMMKRSDSVSKRWSVQANTGLRRGDSVAGTPTSHARGKSRDSVLSRDVTHSSPLADSRKNSNRQPEVFSTEREQSSAAEDVKTIVPEAMPRRSATPDDRPGTPSNEPRLARSPSRTTDPRRWSPTKSTWLGSMLSTASEIPKLQPLIEEQPKWKIDLQRSKSKRGQSISRDKDPDKATSESVQPPISKEGPEELDRSASDNVNENKVDALKGSNDTDYAKPSQSEPPAKIEASIDTSAGEEPSRTSTHSLVALDTRNELSKTTSAPSTPGATTMARGQAIVKPRETMAKPPVLKPKPQTPPKLDFRASLRSSATETTHPAKDDAEFKSIFGKLKRTTTQNYVAPDVLKDNILSGKAALNTIDGPQKTKHRDEFKESILAKKEEWKASSTGPLEQRVGNKEMVEVAIPEALQRRKTLSKPNNTLTTNIDPASGVAPQITNSKLAGRNRVVSPKPGVKPTSLASRSSVQHALASSASSTATLSHAGRVKASVDSSKTTVESLPLTEFSSGAGLKDEHNATIASTMPGTADVTTSSNSKVMSRINPSLVAIIARGPNQTPQATHKSSNDSIANTVKGTKDVGLDPSTSDALTHMTKGRAKGPKRRAPKVESSEEQTIPSTLPATERETDQLIQTDGQPAAARDLHSQSGESLPVGRSAMPEAPKDSALKPVKVVKAPLRPLPQPPAKSSLASESNTQSPDANKFQTEVGLSTPTTPTSRPSVGSQSVVTRRVSKSPPTVRSPQINPKPVLKLSPKPIVKNKIGITSLKTGDEAGSQLDKNAPSVAASEPTAHKTDTDAVARARTTLERTAVAGSRAISKEQPRSDTKAVKQSVPTVRLPSTLPSDGEKSKSSMTDEEIRTMVEAYVGALPQDQQKPDFDAYPFLLGVESVDPKYRTLQHTISEISGDGRKTPMPPQQDHILYEESMYIVSHTFASTNGMKSTEVYLWCGDRVADATVDDVQIFCKREAREYNARLEVVKQGAEHTMFLQALGGIVITRRSKSASFFMLCGRKHLGHIVFDEVDLAASNLCPGYAYLISAQFGKLYLWKGKGANADEIGSARLIGMDLGLTGELEEVEQGSEPAAFWESMTDKKTAAWSQDWNRRAGNDSYPMSLYRIEPEKPKLLGNLWSLARPSSPNKSIAPKVTCEHVSPYSQKSLETPSVHILDTYCALYLLINEKCAGRAAEFISGLHVAQDIAMLLPSAQDRPILPECFVCIGEPPIDVKAAFRKWNTDPYAAAHGSRSLCIPMAQVMEALKL